MSTRRRFRRFFRRWSCSGCCQRRSLISKLKPGHRREQKHNPSNRASFGSCCAVNGRLQSHVAWHRHSSSSSGPVWPQHTGGSWIGKARVRLRTLLHDAPLATQDTLGSVKLFITHLHSDHTVGIPDLWLTAGCHPPTEVERNLLRCWSKGHRGNDVLPGESVPIGYSNSKRRRRRYVFARVAVAAKDFTEGVVYEENGVRVTAFRVHHGMVNKEAFGFRVTTRATPS